MKEFKISGQGYIIHDIITHLNNGHMGMAIARNWNYRVRKNTIYFTLKEGHKVDFESLFWFGYLTAID